MKWYKMKMQDPISDDNLWSIDPYTANQTTKKT